MSPSLTHNNQATLNMIWFMLSMCKYKKISIFIELCDRLSLQQSKGSGVKG